MSDAAILLSFLRGLEVIGGLQLTLFNIREIEGDGLSVSSSRVTFVSVAATILPE